MSAGRHRMMANATAFAQMCRLLNEGPQSQLTIAERTGLAPYTIVKWLRILRNQELVYVKHYIRNSSGRPTAYWHWGYKEPSEPYPKAMSQAEYSERYRRRKAALNGEGSGLSLMVKGMIDESTQAGDRKGRQPRVSTNDGGRRGSSANSGRKSQGGTASH